MTWLKDKKNIHVFVEPGGSHLARIGTMPENQKQKVMSLLKDGLKNKDTRVYPIRVIRGNG